MFGYIVILRQGHVKIRDFFFLRGSKPGYLSDHAAVALILKYHVNTRMQSLRDSLRQIIIQWRQSKTNWKKKEHCR